MELREENLSHFGTALYISAGGHVKVYRVSVNGTEGYAAKYIRKVEGIRFDGGIEAKAMIELKHSSIVELVGVIKGDNYIVIVMKYYERGDLSKEIKRRKRLQENWSEVELWQHFGSMVDVFAYIQGRDYSHRDIKPQNIFLDEAGTFKIADLGGSKGKICECPQDNFTFAGTPSYISPKLRESGNAALSGQRIEHDPVKSDVYSLGVTFLEMCLLEYPEEIKVMNPEILADTIRSLIAKVNSRYSDKVKDLLNKMLYVEEHTRWNFIDLKNKFFSNFTGDQVKEELDIKELMAKNIPFTCEISAESKAVERITTGVMSKIDTLRNPSGSACASCIELGFNVTLNSYDTSILLLKCFSPPRAKSEITQCPECNSIIKKCIICEAFFKSRDMSQLSCEHQQCSNCYKGDSSDCPLCLSFTM